MVRMVQVERYMDRPWMRELSHWDSKERRHRNCCLGRWIAICTAYILELALVELKMGPGRPISVSIKAISVTRVSTVRRSMFDVAPQALRLRVIYEYMWRKDKKVCSKQRDVVCPRFPAYKAFHWWRTNHRKWVIESANEPSLYVDSVSVSLFEPALEVCWCNIVWHIQQVVAFH